ncbi:unnamed protein product [Gongylonema pulchrum]|uniref:Uncharacterized protein n=1 Tax=Gongylonema pulchrum TaxID=637853 RepID=A0A183DYR7_9BILA|nr:unnamed protein product [Gongylonema pulchrum]
MLTMTTADCSRRPFTEQTWLRVPGVLSCSAAERACKKRRSDWRDWNVRRECISEHRSSQSNRSSGGDSSSSGSISTTVSVIHQCNIAAITTRNNGWYLL